MVPGDSVAIDGVISLDNYIDGEVAGSIVRIGQNPIIRPLDVTENGTYAAPDGVEGFNPVTVSIPEYEGAYTVTPTTEVQILPTAGKVMEQDVTVEATDLYGLWTDIIGLYAGRDNTGKAPFTSNAEISNITGEVISGDGAILETYLPVDESYTYIKNGYRLYATWCYDADKRYLGRPKGDEINNLTYGVVLKPFLPGTKYIRVKTHPANNNWPLQIIRIK